MIVEMVEADLKRLKAGGADPAVMRLLVTGASGFVGRRLAAAARARWPQAQVTPLAGPGEAGGADIADVAAVRAAVAGARPTHVAHLAAVAAVTDAQAAPQVAFGI